MPPDNYIEAEEIIRRLDGGVTRPFLCRANNGRHYVAKGLELPPRERITELLCARLAADFGLPIPDHGCIYVDPTLLRYSPEARTDLGTGECFALAYIADATDLLYSQVQKVPALLQKAVFIFDYWVGNSDRQLGQLGGRPNLLMRGQDNQLSLIDHNQAFQWPVNTFDFLQSHVFGPNNRTWSIDLVDQVEYTQRMLDTATRLRQLSTGIPEEWQAAVGTGHLAQLLDEIEHHLTRCKADEFWRVLQ